MDVARRCYSSKWRLDPNADTLTAGRYYFASPGTPAYPGLHCLGSRDWTDKTERIGSVVGEYEGTQTFDAGELPLRVPRPRLVGSADCVARGGGGGALTHATGELDDFLPAGCYDPIVVGPCERMVKCPDMARIAVIMAHVFNAPLIVEAEAAAFVGAGSTAILFAPAPSDRYSGSVVVVNGDEAWQWCDGTRNTGQLLSQAYDTRNGGARFAEFAASQIYWDYATILLTRFTLAGAAGCTRFALVGHSYGGAAASVAAARLKLQDPTRSVSLTTFGAPRAGNRDLIRALTPVCQWHVQRPKDPIPYLPPQLGWHALGFAPLPLIPFWTLWGRYEAYQRRRTIDGNAFREQLPEDGPDNTDMTACITAITTAGIIGGFATHDMRLYAKNVAAHCGEPDPFPTVPDVG